MLYQLQFNFPYWIILWRSNYTDLLQLCFMLSIEWWELIQMLSLALDWVLSELSVETQVSKSIFVFLTHLRFCYMLSIRWRELIPMLSFSCFGLDFKWDIRGNTSFQVVPDTPQVLLYAKYRVMGIGPNALPCFGDLFVEVQVSKSIFVFLTHLRFFTC